jgi:hypothetical protein
MAALVAAIHKRSLADVNMDGRDKPGHDVVGGLGDSFNAALI